MTQNAKLPLPIDPYLDQIVKDGQNHSTLLLKASPGSGKTTRLPWALARALPGKVLVLEPRRLAAKLAAERIAFEEGFKIGEEVGYHFRFDRKLSPNTKLIFYTEGTFLKRFLSDPELLGVDVVILDEFHERHIETDVALAALRSLQKRRPEFKIILMSATLETKVMSEFQDSKTIEIEIPRFPVEHFYLPNVPSVLNDPLEVKIKNALQKIPQDHDVLVFVPGMREMTRTESYLGSQFGKVHLLHADLDKQEQEDALRPSTSRKIILATNIAESSVTIPGIRAVIDSGIQRTSEFSPWTGLRTLVDKPITKSSAIQRAGRAGRTSEGECYRLYSEMDYKERTEFTVPEILVADLTDTYLLTRKFSEPLFWFTPPPESHFKKAEELCRKLGAVDENGKLSAVGEKLTEYPVDARLARVLLEGESYSSSEKRKLLEFISREIEGDRSGVLLQRLRPYIEKAGESPMSFERALLAGFVDQVAKFRPKAHDFIHYSGKSLKIHPELKHLQEGFYLVLDVTKKQEAILVVPIDEDWLYDLDPFPFTEEEQLSMGPPVSLKSQVKLGSLLLEETSKPLDWKKLSKGTKEKILTLGEKTFNSCLQEFQDSKTYLRLHYWARSQAMNVEDVEKTLSLRTYHDQYETLSLDHLNEFFEQTLATSLDVGAMTENLPLKIHLGGKRELEVHYPLNMDPYVEAPIQDFYGQKTTPTILKGKIPLTLKLLGPHKRPIQVTKDLKGFWERTYPQMMKEYLREYPRHHWPPDPAEAEPYLLKSKRI